MTISNMLLNALVSPAYADVPGTTPAAGGGSSMLIMLVVLLAFMYFAVWRPQSKRTKEHRSLLSALAKGDEVVTTGGILGRVSKVADAYVVLALSDTQEVVVQKSSIVSVLPKGTLKSVA